MTKSSGDTQEGQPRDVDRQILGSRLKEAREYLNLARTRLPRSLKVPRSAVSMMEAGQRKVDAIELQKLAEIYQRPIGFFIGEAASPPMPEVVQHLARAASKLTDQDREELLRFAEFLQARSRK